MWKYIQHFTPNELYLLAERNLFVISRLDFYQGRKWLRNRNSNSNQVNWERIESISTRNNRKNIIYRVSSISFRVFIQVWIFYFSSFFNRVSAFNECLEVWKIFFHSSIKWNVLVGIEMFCTREFVIFFLLLLLVFGLDAFAYR